MYQTVRIYESDGVQLEYAIPSSYIKREYIKAYSQTPDETGYFTDVMEPLEFDWLNDGMIKLKQIVPQGNRLIIRRETYADEPLVDFQDAAILVENDLDGSALQSLHVAQEARERNEVSTSNTSERVAAALGEISDTIRETTAIAEKAVEAAEKAAQAAAEAVEIADPEGRFGVIDQRFESIDEAIDEKVNSSDLKAMAYAEDAPADDHLYLRKADSWEVYEEPDSVPFPWLIGQVIQYLGPLPDPAILHPYYLVADGSEVSREDYPELFAAYGIVYGAGDGVTTFGLPDLRGMFMRGLDHGRGVDPGRVLGEQQGDAIRNFTGSIYTTKMGAAGTTGAFRWDNAGSSGPSSNASWQIGTMTLDPSRVVPTADENRPVNMPCNYLIMAKSPAIASSDDFAAAINAVNAGLGSRLDIATYETNRAADAPMRAKAVLSCSKTGVILYAQNISSVTRKSTGKFQVFSSVISPNSIIVGSADPNGIFNFSELVSGSVLITTQHGSGTVADYSFNLVVF